MAPGGVAGGIQLTVKSLQLTVDRCGGSRSVVTEFARLSTKSGKESAFQAGEATLSV